VAKRSPYESGELTDSIFLILLATLEPLHGYGIMRLVQDMTAGAVEIGPATMYTTLRKLCDAGWIAKCCETDSKILYQATSEGREALLADFNRRKTILEIAESRLMEEGVRNV
jgi:DNA-binding PadR family transcriptional regulator